MLVSFLLLCASCVPAEEVPEPLAKDYPPHTTLGAIQERGVLRAGLPGVPELDSFTGAIAQEFADLLGVELEVTEVTPDEVHLRLDDGSIDIGFPLKPLTEQVVRRNTVTDPYLVSFQRLLSLRGDEPDNGAEICVVGEPEWTVEVGSSTRADRDTCIAGLLSRRFLAASGLDVELVAIADAVATACRDASPPERPEGCSGPPFAIGGDQLTVVGLSVFVPRAASDMVSFVERAVAEYIDAGDWLASWTTVYGSYFETPAEPPGLTAEEAAALYPSPD